MDDSSTGITATTPNMSLIISVVNPRQRIKRSCQEILSHLAEIFSFCVKTKSHLAFLPELYTTGYQMTHNKFIEYATLYETENLHNRVSELSDSFKVPILYGYAGYDSHSNKITNCARFYDPNLKIDFIHCRDDYSSQHTVFKRGAMPAPIFSWIYGTRVGFGICLESAKLESVCEHFRGRCDILLSLSTRSNSIIPQPRFLQTHNIFFLHSYYNEKGNDICLTAEVNLLKLARFKKIDSDLNGEVPNKTKTLVKFDIKSKTITDSKAKKAGRKRKTKAQWNF